MKTSQRAPLRVSLFFIILSFIGSSPIKADLKNEYSGWGKQDVFRKTIYQTNSTKVIESICVILKNGKIAQGEIVKSNDDSQFGKYSDFNFDGAKWQYFGLTKDERKKAAEYYKLVKETIAPGTESNQKSDHKQRHVPADFNSLSVSYWLLNAEKEENHYANDWRQFAFQSAYVPRPDGRSDDRMVFSVELIGQRSKPRDQYSKLKEVTDFIDRICKGRLGTSESHELFKDFPLGFTDLLKPEEK